MNGDEDELRRILEVELQKSRDFMANYRIHAENLKELESKSTIQQETLAHELETRREVLEDWISDQVAEFDLNSEELRGHQCVLPADVSKEVIELKRRLAATKERLLAARTIRTASIEQLESGIAALRKRVPAHLTRPVQPVTKGGGGGEDGGEGGVSGAVGESGVDDPGRALLESPLPVTPFPSVESFIKRADTVITMFANPGDPTKIHRQSGKTASVYEFGGIMVECPDVIKYVAGRTTLCLFNTGDMRIMVDGAQAHLFKAQGILETVLPEGDSVVVFNGRTEWRRRDGWVVVVNADGRRKVVIQ